MQGGRPTEARIHLDAVRANLRAVRAACGGLPVIAVVKADAYGHGAPAVAGALAAEGCGRFAVLSVAEAAALRDAGRGEEILVLGGVHDAAEAAEALARRTVPVLHHAGHLELVRAAAARAGGGPAPVEVEVDTGMRRMGVPEAEAPAFLERVAAAPELRLAGAFTHPARADEADPAPTREQWRRFAAVLAAARERGVDPGRVHACNSAAALAGEPAGEVGFPVHAVRVGLALYGAQPSPGRRADLRPAMTLRTAVVHVRDVREGDAVGYGGTWRAPRATRVATLAAGYADGIPRAVAGAGFAVAIAGRRFPLVGRVSMDYVGVDVGDAPVAVGDEAVVFGEGGPSVDELAAAAGTLAYEILVDVGPRVPRRAVGGGA